MGPDTLRDFELEAWQGERLEYERYCIGCGACWDGRKGPEGKEPHDYGCIIGGLLECADAWEADIQLRDAFAEQSARLAERLEAAMGFVIWLSPCGQAENPPTYELIGEKARELLAALAAGEET